MTTLYDMEIELRRTNCRRCGHTWVRRKDVVITCPKCRSPYWDKPREDDNDGPEIDLHGALIVLRVDRDLMDKIRQKAARSRCSCWEEWVLWALKDAIRVRHKQPRVVA